MFQQTFRFTLTGLSPLLCHHDNIPFTDALSERRKQMKSGGEKSVSGDDRSPPETWKGSLYTDGDQIVIPSDLLRACLLKAAARIILKGKKTYKELSACGILFDDAFYPLLVNGSTIPWSKVDAISGKFLDHMAACEKLGFKLHVKRAAVSSSKHVRVRPMFSDWSVTGTLTVIEADVAPVIAEMFELGGRFAGMGDWRPGAPKSPGPYGRFSALVEAA